MANETATKPRRSKGDGTIFKNNKGRWIARYNRKGMPPKEFSGKTKAEVKAKLDEYKFLVQSGEVISLKLTLEQYATKFLHYKSQQVVRKTLKQTAYDRTESIFEKHIQPHPIAKILMCNLRSSDIQGLLDEMQPHYSYSTIRKVYLFLHSMISYGKTEKDLPKTYDPFLTVEMPDESAVGVKTKQIEIIPEEYIEMIKDVALSYQPDGTLSYRYGPALVFILNTGLRQGELLAISKQGIIKDDANRMSIHISETVSNVKNRDKRINKHYIQIITPPKYPRSNRIVPLNQEAQKCLDIMLDTYGQHQIRDDLIVCTNSGNFPTSRNIQETLDRILRKCGLPHYGTHALRHTFATRLLSRTSSHQDIKAVAELLGDDYKVVIKTYLHTDTVGKHDLVDQL